MYFEVPTLSVLRSLATLRALAAYCPTMADYNFNPPGRCSFALAPSHRHDLVKVSAGTGAI
jgi:hypothetical protein